MIKPIFIKFIVLITLILSVHNLNGLQSVSANTKYTYSDSVAIDTTFTYASSTTNYAPLTITITYPIARSSQTLLALITFDDLSFKIDNNRVNISLDIVSVNITSLVAAVSSNLANKVQKLSIRYYLSLQSYAVSPYFSGYSAGSRVNRNITSTSPYSYTYTGLYNIVDMSKGVKTFYSFTGLDIQGFNLTNTLDIYLTITQLTESSVNIMIGSRSSQPTLVNRVKYMWMSYSAGNVNANNFGYFMLGTMTASNGGILSYSNSSSTFKNYNTFTGLSGFSLVGQSFLNFNFDIIDQNNFKISTINNFKYYSFNYLVIYTYYCSSYISYLLTSTNTCTNQCPIRYFSDDQLLECVKCPYDCFSCNRQNICLTCSTADFRQLDYNGRCVPQIGYFDDGKNHSTANKCPNQCSTCTASACQTCIPGYVYKNNFCYYNNQTIKQTIYKDQENNSILLIVCLSIGAATIIVITCIICYRCRMYSHYEQKPNPHDESNNNIQPDKPYYVSAIWRPFQIKQQNKKDNQLYCYCQKNDKSIFVKLQCGHFLHSDCIFNWINSVTQKPYCPFCKKNIEEHLKLICTNCHKKYTSIKLNLNKDIFYAQINGQIGKKCSDCQ